jgi:hypothetical protein
MRQSFRRPPSHSEPPLRIDLFAGSPQAESWNLESVEKKCWLRCSSIV